MDANAKIYVAGHRGLVGSALMRNLRDRGFSNLVTRSHAELDLTSKVEAKKIRAGQDLVIPELAVIDVTRYSMAHHFLIQPDRSAHKLFDLMRLKNSAVVWMRAFCVGILLEPWRVLTHHMARVLTAYSVQI